VRYYSAPHAGGERLDFGRRFQSYVDSRGCPSQTPTSSQRCSAHELALAHRSYSCVTAKHDSEPSTRSSGDIGGDTFEFASG
jgi:hypothetical protein